MNGSLQKRLLLGTTITFVLILSLLGLAVDAAVHKTLVSEFDNTLSAKASALSFMVEQHGEHIKFEFEARDMPEFDLGPHPAYFELWINGKLTHRSPSLRNRTLSQQASPNTPIEFRAITLPDGARGRAAFMAFNVHVDDDARPHLPPASALLVVAKDTGALNRQLLTVRWTIFILCLLAVIISEVALVLVVRRAIRPVHVLAARIEAVGETSLSTRLDARDVPAELRPVVDRLNDLLARLEQAFDRERAFTADVAHELRTPIAGLRTILEVCRLRPREAAAYTAAIDRAVGIIGSMQKVIESLLLLARAENGELRADLCDVDLTQVLREAWSPFASRAAECGLSIHWQVPAECPVRCDLAKLHIILANLFDNAVSYADARGAIDIQLQQSPGHLHFKIANTGNQITPDEVQHVFQRFWRKDESRSQTGVHAGLGLSLCQRLLLLLNGALTVEVEDDRFIATVVIPRLADMPVPTPPPPRPPVPITS